MNKQEILNCWINGIHYRPVQQEAINYATGASSDASAITVSRYCYGIEYPRELVAELDGENAETARRCLYTSVLMRKVDAYPTPEDLGVLKKIGLTLEEILDLPTKIRRMDCSRIAGEALTLFPDEAAKLITPKYLENADGRLTDESRKLAVYIAAKLIEKDEVSGKKLFGKTLCEAVAKYAEKKLSGWDSVGLLIGIYKKDKRFADIVKKSLEHSNYAGNLYNGLYDGDIKKVKETMYDLGLEFDFTYCRAAGIFGDAQRDSCAEELKNDPETLMAIIEKLSEKKPSDREIAAVSYSLLRCLQNGMGKDCLEKFEKLYISLCSSTLAPSINMPTDRFIHTVMLNPERAARDVGFTNKEMYCYYNNYYSWNTALETLARLCEYSTLADNIILCLIRSAEINPDANARERLPEIVIPYCMARRIADGVPVAASLERLLNKGISVETIFLALSYMRADYINCKSSDITLGAAEFVKPRLAEAAKFYGKIKDDAGAAASWAQLIVLKSDYKDPAMLIEIMKSKSKVVGRIANDVIAENEELMRPALEAALPKFKGEALKRAKAMIKKWDNERRFGADFNFTPETAAEYASENLDSSMLRKIAFIPEELFSGVRRTDLSGELSSEVIKCIFGEYMSLDEPYRITVCSKLAETAYKPDLCDCVENIYRSWLEKGADNKTKAVLLPYCIFASDVQITAMKKQLTAWAETMRGALAAYAVNAIALNGSGTALMMINDMSVKFPNNQVKKAAKSAFSFAAEALGVPEEALADKIVPTLGLDKNGEAVLDYGSRTFTVSLMPDFTVSIFDNAKNKAVKSLPKPAALDDEVKAAAAKKYLSDLKKQLKSVTALQKTRLQDAFRSGRSWTAQSWNELFVENPVMHRFARNLIWGAYSEGAPLSTFRYSDDGTFCDENDDEYTLPENARIALVHPIELSRESIDAWTEQLSDYEIVQPFTQIAARVLRLEKGDTDEKNMIVKYADKSFNVGAMTGAAKKYNLVRTTVGDGGCIGGYHIRDKYLGIGMQIGAELMYVGQNFTESVKLGDVCFYKLPETDTPPDAYEEFEGIDPAEISERFVSCCLEILEGILE